MAEVRHQRLRRLYRSQGYSIDDLAEATDQCRNEVSLKLAALRPWTMDDIWNLCSLLNIRSVNIGHYFPRHGIDKFAPEFVGRIADREDDKARKLLEALQEALDPVDDLPWQ